MITYLIITMQGFTEKARLFRIAHVLSNREQAYRALVSAAEDYLIYLANEENPSEEVQCAYDKYNDQGCLFLVDVLDIPKKLLTKHGIATVVQVQEDLIVEGDGVELAAFPEETE